jgi:hypothetical protein
MRTDLDPIVQADLEELERALAGEPSRFTELVSDVRAERPVMTPAFEARLDARVDAARKVPRRRSWPAWSPAAGAVAALVVALVISAVIAGGGGSGSKEASSASSGASTQSAPADRSTELAAPLQSSGGATAPRPQSGRKVERNTDLQLSTARGDVQSVADDVVSTTQRFGGIVDSSQISTSDSEASATFSLRIPTARLDEAVAALSKLAHVGSLSEGSTDITGSFVTVLDRLKDARAERRALLKALGRATTAQQVDAIKARLRDNRSQIAAIKGELKSLRRRANLSRVNVAVEGSGHKTGGGTWTPGDAADDALRVLEVTAGVLLIGLAVLLPLALLGGGAALAGRSARRRRRESALDGV